MIKSFGEIPAYEIEEAKRKCYELSGGVPDEAGYFEAGYSLALKLEVRDLAESHRKLLALTAFLDWKVMIKETEARAKQTIEEAERLSDAPDQNK